MVSYYKQIIISCFLFQSSLCSFSQSFNLKHFSVQDGLAQSNINCPFQDSKGRLWLPTGGGLTYYDGIDLYTFTQKDGLPGIPVFNILEDEHSVIWGTTAQNGIFKWEKGRFTTFTSENGLVSNTTRSIYQDSQNRIWIITKNGCSLFDGKHFLNFNQENGLGSDDLIEIFEDSKRNIWLGGKNAVMKFDGKQFHTISFDSLFVRNFYVYQIFEDSQGLMWFVNPHGMIRYQAESSQLTVFPQQSNLNGALADAYFPQRKQLVLENKDGSLYFANLKKGILIYQDGLVKSHPINKQLPTTAVAGIYHDTKNRMWYGLESDGVVLISDKQMWHLNSRNGLKNAGVSQIFEDYEGNIWLNTRLLISKFESLVFTHFDDDSGLTGGHPTAIFKEKSGLIWIGNQYGYLFNYKNNRLKTVYIPQPGQGFRISSLTKFRSNILASSFYDGIFKLTNDRLIPIKENQVFINKGIDLLHTDRFGRLWIGQIGKLSCIGPTGIDHYQNDSLLSETRLTALIEVSKDNFWLGSSKGIYRFQNGKFSRFQAQDDFFSGWSIDLVQAKNGAIWVSTAHGVARIRGSRIDKFTPRQGLTCPDIYSLLLDEEDQLWIGHGMGLDKLSTVEFEQNNVAKFKHYGLKEGFRGIECNMNVSLLGDDQRLWFGHLEGISIYDPKEDLPKEQPPLLHLSEVLLFNQKVDWHRSPFKLPYDQNHVSFDYQGISLSNGSKVRYRYKLEGLEEAWSDPTRKNYTTYTNLEPGNYAFKVQAVNENGIWTPKTVAFNFSILAPFWEKSWFYALSILFLVITAYMLVRFYLQKIRQEATIQQRILDLKQTALNAQINPHFIFNALNSVQNFIAKNDKKEANLYLSKFGKLIRQILENSRRSLVPLKNELEALQLYLELESARFQKQFIYRIQIDKNVDSIQWQIPPMIIQPFVENAIWHGLMHKKGMREVEICFKPIKTDLLCIIKDNGIGRAKASALKNANSLQSKSLGISITKERLDLFNRSKGQQYQIKIIDLKKDGKAAGTKVKIRLPIIKEFEN